MINKKTYILYSAFLFGLLESFFYDLYGYYELSFFFIAVILIMSFDIIYQNSRKFKNIKDSIAVSRKIIKKEVKKGDKIEVQLSIKNSSSATLEFKYLDNVSDVFLASGPISGLLKIKGGEVKNITYTIEPQIIGTYEIGPLEIISYDSLGLTYNEFEAKIQDKINVGPSEKDVHSQRSERTSNILYTSGYHFSRKAGQGYDFYGIRAYDNSDDVRVIAWGRYNISGTDDLYTKLWEEQRQIDVVFVIDYSSGSNLGYAYSRLFDFYITVVLNCAYIVLKNQDRVGFIVYSSETKIAIKPSSRKDSITDLEKQVSRIRPSGTFDLKECMDFAYKEINRKPVFLVFQSPYSLKMAKKWDLLNTKNRENIFIYTVNPGDFYNLENIDYQVKLYGLTVANREIKELRANIKFLRSFGIKSVLSSKDRVFINAMVDYSVARNQGRGA